jgi:hypothetical protein
VQIWNNAGQNHTTYAQFSNIPDFGIYFVQAATTDLPTGGSGIAGQYYTQSFGLGNDYGYTSYGMQWAMGRNIANPYLNIRYRENTFWGSWSKISAGYADSAGSATTATTATNLSGGSVAATSITGTNIYASGSFVLNGSGGAYQAGSIYSDTNWGMILRAYQASPALAQFLFVNSAGTEQCRITTLGGFTSINDITAYSDIRHKTNIKRIENPLDKVLAMNGYTFNRTDCEEEKERRYVGVVAQEVLEVLPEVVHMKEDGMYSVAYGNITALLIEALKEERAERLKLEQRLERLEKLLFKE